MVRVLRFPGSVQNLIPLFTLLGKSCFGLYTLLRCMANEQAVVFFTSYGQAFYFDESGVRTCPTAEVNPRILFSDVDGFAHACGLLWTLPRTA